MAAKGLAVQTRLRILVACLAVAVGLLATSVPAAAAPKRISGRLSTSGYTVIALAASGKAKAVRVRRHSFRLRLPAKRVTLHLRSADGVYAGPIVIGRKKRGRRAVLGVRAGAKLGRINVRRGYAKLAKRLRKKWVDKKRVARARKGVPIGAGKFGRVRSKPPRRSVPGDRDLDGIPNVLDIDDDGDRVLDKLDRSRRVRSAQDSGRDPFDLASGLGVPLERTANVNAGSTDAQIDATLPDFGYLLMSVPKADSVELDCGGTTNLTPPPPLIGGLSYCSYGGTGRIGPPPRNPGNAWPERSDEDHDGYGTLEPVQTGPDFVNFKLDHGARSSEIGTGDQLILRVTDGGQETQLTDVQQFIFATVPALASYVDETGTKRVVSYPVKPGDPGTSGNGFPVVDGPDADSDVELTVTLWRPQRRPIGTESGSWVDVGGLDYTAASREASARTNDAGWCQQSAFATSDPNLSPGFPDPQGGGFRDLAPARPANAANTFTYRLNLTMCLQRYGIGFTVGETQAFSFEAFTPITGGGSAGVDNAMTEVSFTRH
jgi:hypothetical protein